MSRRVLPFEVAVTAPCQQDWDAMQGSARQRHCAACDRDVLNFAAMTPRQIEQAVALSGGHLCARISRREDGSLVTLPEPVRGRAAGFVLAAALASAPAFAQTGDEPKAVVSGKVLNPKTGDPSVGAQVLFIRDHASVLEVKTDAHGKWRASLPPGTYDVVFRNNILVGARVVSAQFHTGEQSFAPVHEQFAYGHLGIDDNSTQTYTTTGVMVATLGGWRSTMAYRIKHPIRYLRYLRQRYL
jgi:hypothetical protein